LARTSAKLAPQLTPRITDERRASFWAPTHNKLVLKVSLCTDHVGVTNQVAMKPSWHTPQHNFTPGGQEGRPGNRSDQLVTSNSAWHAPARHRSRHAHEITSFYRTAPGPCQPVEEACNPASDLLRRASRVHDASGRGEHDESEREGSRRWQPT
jgi:hypothetical protein